LWERHGNVPALVRLIQAYVRKVPRFVVDQNYLTQVLGIFQKLVASSTHDHEGFYILEAVTEYLTPNDLLPYTKSIFTLIFMRLQKEKTLKFVRSFLVFLSIFIAKHGPDFVIQQIDSVGENLFARVLESLWIPTVQKISGKVERKLAAVAMIKLIGESKDMQERYLNYWGKLMATLIAFIQQGEEEQPPTDNEEEIEIEDFESFNQLTYASKKDDDPFRDVNLVQMLSAAYKRLLQQNPGKVKQKERQSLEFFLISHSLLFLSLSLFFFLQYAPIVQMSIPPESLGLLA
jgi:exportin-2 (importin alpha re-exporter)